METTKHCREIAARLDGCERWLVATLAELGEIGKDDAVRAAREFKRLRIAKRDAFHSRYSFTHGAYLDRDVIRCAAGVAESKDGAR